MHTKCLAMLQAPPAEGTAVPAGAAPSQVCPASTFDCMYIYEQVWIGIVYGRLLLVDPSSYRMSEHNMLHPA